MMKDKKLRAPRRHIIDQFIDVNLAPKEQKIFDDILAKQSPVWRDVTTLLKLQFTYFTGEKLNIISALKMDNLILKIKMKENQMINDLQEIRDEIAEVEKLLVDSTQDIGTRLRRLRFGVVQKMNEYAEPKDPNVMDGQNIE